MRALFGVASLPSSDLARDSWRTRIAGARGTKPPSLLLDLRRAKPQTEVDVLNGAVAAAGLEQGVPAPVNAVYARVLNDIAHTPPLWAKYREQPDRLEAEVEAEVRRDESISPEVNAKCATRTFPNRWKAGGFFTGCSR